MSNQSVVLITGAWSGVGQSTARWHLDVAGSAPPLPGRLAEPGRCLAQAGVLQRTGGQRHRSREPQGSPLDVSLPAAGTALLNRARLRLIGRRQGG